MAVATDIGTGATIAFSESTGLDSWELLSIEVADMSREAIRTSHMGTAANSGHTYIPADIPEPPKITAEFHFEYDASIIPWSNGVETITITTSGSTFSGSGFITNFGFSVPFEDVMTATVEIQGSGTWAVA